MQLLQHFNINLEGNDYFCTDVHGCYDKLEAQLAELGFNDKDRLFLGGDLVDRGPRSADFVDWLLKKNVHSVRGNHDQMIIDSVEGSGNAYEMHAMNGGTWFYVLPEVEQQCMAIMMAELPLAIEIDTPHGLVGIVHAESPSTNWYQVRTMLAEQGKDPEQVKWYDRVEAVMMWARSKIELKDDTPIEGLHRLYVGHTPHNEVVVLGNVHYMDTGVCFKGGKLTIVKIN